MSLYRGYISANAKAATEPFKNKQTLRSIESAKKLKGYAGVLEEDTVMIDIDDPKEADLMMDIVEGEDIRCRVVKTKRGRHFLFKTKEIEKNRQHTKLALGLTADIKVGSRASYEILKIDGREREIEWDANPDEDYQQLPKWMLPVTRSTVDFKSLDEGEGRNQALYNYILTMQSNGFPDEDIIDTIKIINQYILKTAMSDEEIATITRDEAFQTPSFYNGRDFLFDKFAMWLIGRYHIIRINKQIYLYRDGVYVLDDGELDETMLSHISKLRRAQRKEVADFIKSMAPKKETDDINSTDYIAFNNGILNWRTGVLSDFTPDIVLTNKIPHDYNPSARSNVVDKALDEWSCHDPEIRSLLEECIGYCFLRENSMQKSFILIGRRANGKSTFLNCVRTILGDDNVSALDLSELGDRFSTSMLFEKLANIGDDISDDFMHGTQAAIFKKIVTGEQIKAEKKGQDPFNFKPTAKLLFSTNNMLRIRDRTGAILRRLTIIPFDTDFSNTKNDPHIIKDLTRPEAIQYMIVLAVRGLQRLMKTEKFTQSERINVELRRYEEENDPLIGFLNDYNPNEFVHEHVSDVYTQYKVYCAENNITPLSQKSFSAEMRTRFGIVSIVKKINGKPKRIYEFLEKVTDGNG